MLEIRPLGGIPEVAPGDELARMLADAYAAEQPMPGDILVVTQKIVSKAEGRLVSLAEVSPSLRAQDIATATRKDPRLVELVLAESSELIRAAPGVLIARHRSGHVMANAGIDGSNLGPVTGTHVLLLPEDADASARALAEGIALHIGFAPGIVISDSFGRPWRNGVVNVAIGCAGVPALTDLRGTPDRDGRVMQATLVANADLIASAAGLAMGEATEGMPAALVRGLVLHGPPTSASALLRPAAEDLFR